MLIGIYKPKGPTSNRVLTQIKKISGVKKIGHAGTLDPLASGVLVVAISRQSTKKIAEEVKKEKEYIADITLGMESTTDDEQGEKTIWEVSEVPEISKVLKALTGFIGTIEQLPPIYSAIKINGKEAYKYARSGKEVAMVKRAAFIKEIELLEYNYPYLKIRVVTGKGVYIRTLAKDIGIALKTGAYMSDLVRIRVGDFTLENAHQIEDLAKINFTPLKPVVNYQDKQNKLFNYIEKSFREGKTPSTVSPVAEDFEQDNRISLSSAVFPDSSIQERVIEHIITPLKKLDSHLFFYSPERLHCTIKNIRVINYPPDFNEETIEKVKQVLKKVIPKHHTFAIHFKGLFELPVSLALRGYCNENLGDLIKEITYELEKAGVPDNKKYASSEVYFGNMTLCRYQQKPNQAFFEKVKELKKVEVGSLKVETIKLFTANIVLAPQTLKIIDSVDLNNQ